VLAQRRSEGIPLVVVPGRTHYDVFQAPEPAGPVASFLA
jgi:hypothetical protein